MFHFCMICKNCLIYITLASILCQASWNLPLYMCSIIFNQRLKRTPRKIFGALYLCTLILNNCLLFKFHLPQLPKKYFQPQFSGTAMLCLITSSCTAVQKLGLGRKPWSQQGILCFLFLRYTFLQCLFIRQCCRNKVPQTG